MKSKFNVSAGAILMLSALYFFGGMKSVCAVILAASVHELGHIIAIKMFGGKIRSLRFDASGLCMSYCGLDSAVKELVSLVTGPLFGLALAYAASYYGNTLSNNLLRETAGISMMFSVFNLLPALPLDGGRALFCMINGRHRAENVLDKSGMITGLLLVFSGLYFLGNEKGAALLISGCLVLIAQTGIVKNFRML